MAYALDDVTVVKIRVADGELRTRVASVDPVSDIADQDCTDDYFAFCESCESQTPVPLSFGKKEPSKAFSAWIRTHYGTWIRCRAEVFRKISSTIALTAEGQVRGGTSGGPVVDENGEVLGIASNFSDHTTECVGCTGWIPWVRMALPVWAVEEILASQCDAGEGKDEAPIRPATKRHASGR